MSTAIIELTVRGKGRPRFSMRGGKPIAYSDKTTKEMEEDIVRKGCEGCATTCRRHCVRGRKTE